MGEKVEEAEMNVTLQLSKDVVFESLMRDYGQQVIQLVYLFVRDRILAEDITQEVFLKAYKGLDSFRGETTAAPGPQAVETITGAGGRSMDVDQWMREYARLDKQQAAHEVKFTPALANRIRKAVHGNRRSTFRRYGIGLAGVAAGVWLLSSSPWNGLSVNKQQVESIPNVSQSDQKELAQTVLNKMRLIIPELKDYQLEGIADTSIRLRKNSDIAAIQFLPLTGEIEYFDLNMANSHISKRYPSVQLAKDRATQFLKQIMGDVSDQYEADVAVNVATGKQITFQRYLNGLPVLWDTVHVIVNEAGQVVTYEGLSRIWDVSKVTVADTTAAISMEEAITRMKQQMKLRYVEDVVTKSDPVSGKPIEKRTLLEYTPNMISYSEFSRFSPDWNIDAQTGKFLALMEEPTQSFTIKPPAEYVTIKNNQDVEKLIEEVCGVPVDSKQLKVIPNNHSPIQEVVYSPRNGNPIVVDYFSTSGILKSIRIDSQVTDKKIGKDDALKTAVKFMEKYGDPGVQEIAATQVRESGSINRGSYEVHFYKKHDGILVTSSETLHGAYTVAVDPATGQVNGFRREGFSGWQQPNPNSYPAKQSVVPLETAMQEYLKHVQLKLAYQYERVNGSQEGKLRLVYIPYPVNHTLDAAYNEIHLDAITGQVIQYQP